MVGIGAQVFTCTYAILIFSCIAFHVYNLRPYLFTICVFALACTGWMNGYMTARILKFFGSTDWCFSAFIASTMFPCFLIFTCGFIDVLEWIDDSSATIPFSRAFFYFIGWLVLDVPLCFHGSWAGFKQAPTQKVCKVNTIKRKIPAQPAFLAYQVIIPVFGAVISATVFVEFKYIWESVWGQYMYGMFGFLTISFLLMAVVISLLSMVQIYLQFSYGNYEWWWRTFFLGASGGFYLAAYAVIYMAVSMDFGNLILSDVIYMLFLTMFVTCYSLMCGSIACMSGFIFVEGMYRHVKFD